MLCSVKKDISGSCDRHWGFVRKPVYGVGNMSGVCGWCPHVVIAVVIKAGSNVIALGGMDSKSFSAFTCSSLRTLIPGGVSGLWVDAGRAKKVEDKCCLW